MDCQDYITDSAERKKGQHLRLVERGAIKALKQEGLGIRAIASSDAAGIGGSCGACASPRQKIPGPAVPSTSQYPISWMIKSPSDQMEPLW